MHKEIFWLKYQQILQRSTGGDGVLVPYLKTLNSMPYRYGSFLPVKLKSTLRFPRPYTCFAMFLHRLSAALLAGAGRKSAMGVGTRGSLPDDGAEAMGNDE
jgi:hypothetical protein